MSAEGRTHPSSAPDGAPPPGLAPGAFTQPRIDYYLAALAAVIALVLYGMTVQRTLSFWDCGEFIACATILGVPHPPGTPLYILLGRLFSLFPVPADIGLRVNLLSVFSSALAVALGYLIVARIVRRYLFRGASFWGRGWIVFTAGLSGAIMSGFGRTVWINAIEAEVYGVTLLAFYSLIYIALVWVDVRYEPRGQRLLVLATFVAVLGLSVHMMIYLALPGLWLTVFLLRPDWRRHWILWVAVGATMAVMISGVEAFLWNLVLVLGTGILWLALARTGRRTLAPWIVPAWMVVQYAIFSATLPLRTVPNPELLSSSGAIGQWFESFYWSNTDWILTLLVTLGLQAGCIREAVRGGREHRQLWALPVGLAAAALVGYSVHGFIPLRSRLDPSIDENSPETWESFKGFVERKQYGSQSMVARMLKRRGDWAHQLGRHPRMGFWSFFETQYGIKSGPYDLSNPAAGTRSPAFLLLVGLGLFGVGYLGAVYWRIGLPLVLTLFLATVGLVIYMNFADGTRYNPRVSDQAYLEVRDRDYFFTTGFALFGLCIGLGTAAFLRVFLDPGRPAWRVVVTASSAVFLFALPAKTVVANYWQCDRSRDLVPYDYAWNLLQSCDRDGILFTTGDNDTFPLWCLQEAYGIRRDVDIVNLSLANTHWYIRQMKNRHGVPFALTNDEIDLMRPTSQLGRVQAQVVNIVLESNQWRRPIYFGTSSPESVRRYRGAPLDSNLRLEGMVMRVVPDRGARIADRELVMKRYTEEYRYRSVADTTIFKNETTRRIADNYATGLLYIADEFRRQGRPDRARTAAALAMQLRPRLPGPRVYRAQLAGEYDRKDELDSMLETLPVEWHAELYYNYAVAAEVSGDPDRALPAYLHALGLRPTYADAFRRAAACLYERHRYDTLLDLIDLWIGANPTDTLGPILRAEVQHLQSQTGAAPGEQEGP